MKFNPWTYYDRNRARLLDERDRYSRASRMRAARIGLTAAEKAQVAALYEEAARRTAETGSEWQVDHIVPIARGGKHHPDNLQVISAVENLTKHAREWTAAEFLAWIAQ